MPVSWPLSSAVQETLAVRRHLRNPPLSPESNSAVRRSARRLVLGRKPSSHNSRIRSASDDPIGKCSLSRCANHSWLGWPGSDWRRIGIGGAAAGTRSKSQAPPPKITPTATIATKAQIPRRERERTLNLCFIHTSPEEWREE